MGVKKKKKSVSQRGCEMLVNLNLALIYKATVA